MIPSMRSRNASTLFRSSPPNEFRAEIAAIAEELDAHRKARIAAHPHLTLTSLYNVLAAIRAGTVLSPAERDIHDTGQVSILRHLHDRLDDAVADAYGWPRDLSDAEIVARVVALNSERRAEETTGLIRWLRPDYQAPTEAARPAQQTSLDVGAEAVAGVLQWPKAEPDQFVMLRASLRHGPVTVRDIAKGIKGAAGAPRMARMLEILVAIGQARSVEGGRFSL